MGAQQPAYNLLDEPWIQVEMLDGQTVKLGLKALFEDAHRIRTISGELPHMHFVTVRLCEAILYCTYGVSGQGKQALLDLWREIWELGHFPQEEIAEYLDEYRARFDLFGDKPFYQVADLAYVAADPSPVSAIMPDVPTRLDKTLFSMRSFRHAGTLTFDEAARYLLVAQGYDTSGIKTPVVGNTHVNKGKVYPPKNLPGTGWCGGIGGTVVEGESLFETLMLNWVLFDDRSSHIGLLGIDGDSAPWERDDIGPDMVVGEPSGPIQMLTWQSRRIRLIPDEGGACVAGVVLCYGDAVRPIDKKDIEMMTPWRKSEAQQKKWSLPYVPWMARKHDPNKSIWRGLSSLIAYGDASGSGQPDMRPGVIRWVERLGLEGAIGIDKPLAIRAQGMEYGTNDSVYADAVDDEVSLHALMLRHDAEATVKTLEVIARTDKAVGSLIRFVQNVLMAKGDRRRYNSMGDTVAGAVRQDVATRAYDELDGLFRERIAHLGPNDDVYDYCASWLREAHRKLVRIAEGFLSESDISLFEGGAMSAGRALEQLRRSLNQELGPLSAGSASTALTNDELEKDGVVKEEYV